MSRRGCGCFRNALFLRGQWRKSAGLSSRAGQQTLALRNLVLHTNFVAAFLLPKALELLTHMRYNFPSLIL